MPDCFCEVPRKMIWDTPLETDIFRGPLIKYCAMMFMGIAIVLLPLMALLPDVLRSEVATGLMVGLRAGRCHEACAAKEMRSLGPKDGGCLCRSPYNETVRTSTHTEPEPQSEPLIIPPFMR